jgi:hypothetical protein
MSKAVLFGINYIHTPSAQLRGCVNDVNNMAKYLTDEEKYEVVKVYTDESNEYKTRANSIINILYKLAIDSHRLELKKVWIHFSGHGCYIPDHDGDEKDGKDECIVPSDFRQSGVITDDLIKRVLRYFNKNTKVTCVFDCCHSGTVCDLKYLYNNKEPVEVNTISKCEAKVCMISGCMDNQTSADAYNVQGKREFSGAMTSCLLMTLSQDKKIFNVMYKLRSLLRQKGFTQYPQLASSYVITDTESLC